MPSKICRLFMGLPSSGKRYKAEHTDWAAYYGVEPYQVKIANNDNDYNFATYSSQGYLVVLIWNPAWIADSQGLSDMVYDAEINGGYTIEKEYFENDTVQTKCNAYTRWGQKLGGDSKYYQFLSDFIDTYTRDYEIHIKSIEYSAPIEDFGVPVIASLTPIERLDKEGCKGGGGDFFPCIKC